MFDTIGKRLRRFADSPPGQRFQQQHQQHRGQRNAFIRCLRLAAGVVVTLLGIVMMPAPGPGTLVVALGLSILAHESRVVAKALDAMELRLRPIVLAVLGWWRRRGNAARVALGLVGALIAGAFGWLGLALMG